MRVYKYPLLLSSLFVTCKQCVNRYRKKGARYRSRYFAKIVSTLLLLLLSWQVRSLPLLATCYRYFIGGGGHTSTHSPKNLCHFLVDFCTFQTNLRASLFGPKKIRNFSNFLSKFYNIRCPKNFATFSLL